SEMSIMSPSLEVCGLSSTSADPEPQPARRVNRVRVEQWTRSLRMIFLTKQGDFLPRRNDSPPAQLAIRSPASLPLCQASLPRGKLVVMFVRTSSSIGCRNRDGYVCHFATCHGPGGGPGNGSTNGRRTHPLPEQL